MKTGAAVGTYNDNGASYCGTQFTAGDGSSGFLRDYGGALKMKWFGAKFDGSTDDTSAIAATFTESVVVGLGVAAPYGTAIHTGFTVPANTTFMGQGKESTFFQMKDSTNPTHNILVDGPGVFMAEMTIDGNRDNNTSGIGIDVFNGAAGATLFRTFNLEVRKCAEEGFKIKLAHAGHMLNTQVHRCATSMSIERSAGFVMTGCALEKFTTAGLVVTGSASAPMTLQWNGGYMETSTDTPTAGAPFFKFASFREEDFVSIEGMYCNGNFATQAYDTVGIEIDTPIMIDQTSFRNTTFKDIKTAGLFTSIGVGDIGEVDLSGVQLVDGTPDFPRNIGIRTKNSYDISFVTEGIDLTSSGTISVYPINGGSPIRVKQLQEWITIGTDATPGNVSFGVNGSGTAFGSTAITASAAVDAVDDILSLLTNTELAATSFERIIIKSDGTATTGSAKYMMKATVY